MVPFRLKMTMMHGLGMFLASADMARKPVLTAKRILDCGGSWAAILVESVDGRRQKIERVSDIVKALRDVDVDPVLYTFPTASRIQKASAHLLRCANDANVEKLCLDLEPFKGEDWSSENIRKLYELTSAASAVFKPSITLYTRSQWDDILWGEIAPEAEIWLQVYDRVKESASLRRAVAKWQGRHVVPLFGTYAGDLARLDNDLGNVKPYAVKAGASGVWALATTDAREAAALRAYALGL